MGVQYTICHWAINRIDPQNSLSTTLNVLLHELKYMLEVLIIRDCSRCLINLNQTVYIQYTIIYFKLKGSTPVSISLVIKYDFTLFQLSTTETEKCAYKDYFSNLYYLLLVSLFLFAT